MTFDFETRFVAFIDILGFRDSVKKASSDPSLAKTINDALDRIQSLASIKGNLVDAKVTVFSDSVVMSVPKERAAATAFLQKLAEMVWMLMSDDIWMRGGFSLGKLHHQGNTAWGPAFIDAYDTENALASYPRLAFSGPAIEWLNRDEIPVTRDPVDGVWSLDSFGFNLRKINDIGTPSISEAKAIRDRLNSKHTEITANPRVYEKYSWLRERWDASLSESGIGNEELYSCTRGQSRVGIAIDTLPPLPNPQ